MACSPRFPDSRTEVLSFEDLPGWSAADHDAALAAFSGTLALARPSERLRTTAADWSAVSSLFSRSRFASARAAFEAAFAPALATDGASALFTGYYEPELDASRTRGGPYQTPLLAPPPDLTDAPHLARADIRRGALTGRAEALFWLADPVEAFFLHIQGSGRLRLDGGGVARVGFAAKNNRPYQAIGRILVERGEMRLEDVDADAIRAWLRADSRRADELMDQNPSYVFFRELTDLSPDEGPIGAMGASVVPGVSAAVDPAIHPLGAPLFVEAADEPAFAARLMVAHDVGGAIKGAQRADLFVGSGDEAGALAGRLRSGGRLVTLIPRAAAARLESAA